MPKVKDLGITVVPEQFRPVEIGPGGGCGGRTWCGGFTFCTDCTNVPFSICGTTPGPPAQQAVGGGCTDCTSQQFSICGTTPGGCTDCTTQQFSICGTTPGGCTDCTTQQFSICGTTWQGCKACSANPTFCTDCTNVPFSICGTTPGPCLQQSNICGITRIAVACRLQSRFPTILDVTTPCGGSFVGPTGPAVQPGGALRVEDIAQIKAALQAQIQALEEHEKTLGPQTVEEVEAREKELNAELGKLKSLRTEMGKKK